jgi:hypothetical protein
MINGLFPGFAIGASSTSFYMVPPNGTGPILTPTPSPTPTPTPSATPSGSATPTPSGSFTPTPTPSASPTPSPTPTALCIVPNFTSNGGVPSAQVVSTWTGAGFQAGNITNNVPSNKKAKFQSLGAGSSWPCHSATIIVN